MNLYIEYIDDEPMYASTTKNEHKQFSIDFVPTNKVIYMVKNNFFNDEIDAIHFSLMNDEENYNIHILPLNKQVYDKDYIPIDQLLMTPFKWLSNLILDYRIYNGLNDEIAFKEAYHILKYSDFLHITLIKKLLEKYPTHREIFKEKLHQTNYLRSNKFPTLKSYIDRLYPIKKY